MVTLAKAVVNIGQPRRIAQHQKTSTLPARDFVSCREGSILAGPAPPIFHVSLIAQRSSANLNGYGTLAIPWHKDL